MLKRILVTLCAIWGAVLIGGGAASAQPLLASDQLMSNAVQHQDPVLSDITGRMRADIDWDKVVRVFNSYQECDWGKQALHYPTHCEDAHNGTWVLVKDY
ncbi:hypothetical protein [Nocardia sp. NPDC050175]|uniref:hypothetical protein n=1 Tax=Nocardia sp. NPDC050175 TaxID=3364317 RepID=UPI0037B32635